MKTSTILIIVIFSGLLFYLSYRGFSEFNSALKEVKTNNSLVTVQVTTTPLSGNFLQTTDGAKINYNYNYSSPYGVILLPQIGKDKSSYLFLEKALNKNGITTISIDFRGMGQSVYSKSFFNFTEKDFNDMQKDVEAAAIYLKQNNVTLIGLIGASIGANHALNYALKYKVSKAVLLSPGLDYRGVTIFNSLNKTFTNLLVYASKEDSYAFVSSEKLEKNYTGDLKFIRLNDKGHGTNMLDLDIINQIVNFFNLNSYN